MTKTEFEDWGFAMEIYRFRVKGHLSDRWLNWLDGLSVQRQEDGTTLMVGPVVDQAALHGVIIRIRDLGLPLLSLSRVVEVCGRRPPGKLPRFHHGAHSRDVLGPGAAAP